VAEIQEGHQEHITSVRSPISYCTKSHSPTPEKSAYCRHFRCYGFLDSSRVTAVIFGSYTSGKT